MPGFGGYTGRGMQGVQEEELPGGVRVQYGMDDGLSGMGNPYANVMDPRAQWQAGQAQANAAGNMYVQGYPSPHGEGAPQAPTPPRPPQAPRLNYGDPTPTPFSTAGNTTPYRDLVGNRQFAPGQVDEKKPTFTYNGREEPNYMGGLF